MPSFRKFVKNPLTALILRLKGHKILARDYRTPVGKISFVTLQDNRLAFIEVRVRKVTNIPSRHRRRMIRAAQYWLAAHSEFSGRAIGFDAVFGVAWPKYVPDVFGTRGTRF
jgi:putative endonuclease